ncbi:hypothetical protein AVEN_165870-1 [Araneus ventricosus]|uniref:CCHC-type domain-containing protein n=1 Tax=Araneus ventricosus TaxID=182803 RepID=A0A4Y2K8K6_ARAVE|nr:hypothetical protein AVEN_165870-1 [Araneus ventricosus]
MDSFILYNCARYLQNVNVFSALRLGDVFNTLSASSITAGYIRSPVKPYIPYIPNPLRCFNCQRFEHSKVACRGQLTCSNCGIAGHSANGCKANPHCFHCKQDHSSDSQDCPQLKTEKKIQEIKIKQNITYAEAKNLISQEKTPSY